MTNQEVFLITGLLFLWNLAVIQYISRLFYAYFKRFEGVPAAYIGRKIVHILGGGITGLLTPVFFEGNYHIVAVFAFLLAGYVQFRRSWRLMYWFQVRENAYEVHFALAYGAVLILGMGLGDIWIGLIPVLLMSFGDSATGLVRAFTQKRQTKSWDGTFAMFIVCSLICFWKLGPYGILLGATVSLVERIRGLDDNITVPVVAAVLVYLGKLLF